MNYLILYCVLMMFWLAQYFFCVLFFVGCTQYIHVYAIKMIKFFFHLFPSAIFFFSTIHSRHQAESRIIFFLVVAVIVVVCILKAIEIDRGTHQQKKKKTYKQERCESFEIVSQNTNQY